MRARTISSCDQESPRAGVAHQLGLDLDELLVQYPSSSAANLYAAFLYYLDHSGEIDALLQEADQAPEGRWS